LETELALVHHEQGRLIGRAEILGDKLQRETELQTLTEEVVNTSEIEGESLNVDSVRSSIARRLNIDIGGLKPADRNVEGVVAMTLDATGHYREPLTASRLFGWHAPLFATGRSGAKKIRVGAWRDDAGGPMYVMSGRPSRERIHFQAPPAGKLDTEMQAFLEWFNGNAEADWIVKGGLAHLWFVTVHPFDDGNGRIARAIADMSLARSDNAPHRFYSMSRQIGQERKSYYDILEQTQKGTMNVAPWMTWFLGCLHRSIESSQTAIGAVLVKARFWDGTRDVQINPRQRLVLNRLLNGFEGKLTTSKWATVAKCSHDTALRDIQALVDHGILTRNPEGGRSTSYSLAARITPTTPS